MPSFGGSWTAVGDDGSTASFAIDQQEELSPVAIDQRSFSSALDT